MQVVLSVVMLVVAGLAAAGLGHGADARSPRSSYAAWSRGPSPDPSFFPLGVCTQDPARAKEYRELGINMYFSIWDGPSDQDLARLREAGMVAMCEPDAWQGKGWAHRDAPGIAAWVQVDEPDNAQREEGGGYGKAIPPEKIMAAYNDLRKRDPTRPVVLCLGQGVANDEWVGRGCEMSDYPKYAQACDILVYDVYPVVGIRKPDGENYLWYVAKGLDRLRAWSGGKKIVWNAIECTHINNPDKKATPDQVRAEVWMSLIHGSMGIMYFVHQFQPTFVEAGLLIDPEMMAAVKSINQQILALAPVLNSPTIENAAKVTSTSPDTPVDLMAKRQGDLLYLFAVGMRNHATRGLYQLGDVPKGSAWENGVAEVIGENRRLPIRGGKFQDDFRPYEVHLYRIAGP